MKKNEGPEDLVSRSRRFAVDVVRFYAALPKGTVFLVLGRQLLRSGTSVGAQYREACRAKSKADFISKIEGALQELDETSYWFELLKEAGLSSGSELTRLTAEANELISIFVRIVKKVKSPAPNAV